MAGEVFSSALDDAYLWAAIRYVERNPVRARLVRRAEDYRWSSAAAHCEKRQDSILTVDRQWTGRLSSVDDWSTWLGDGDRPRQRELLRRHIERGLPCGSEEIVSRLERLSGRSLRFRPRGRPERDAEQE